MDLRWKKVALLFGLVIVTAGVGYGLYRVFFASKPNETVSNEPFANNKLPNAGTATGTGSTPLPPGTLPGSENRPIALPTPTQPLNPLLEALPRAQVIRTTPTTQISGTGAAGGAIRSYSPIDGKFYKILEDGSAIPLSNKVFYSVKDVAWANRSDRAVLSFPDGSKVLYDFVEDKQTTLPKHWDGFSFSPDDDKIVTKSVGNDPSNRFLIIADPENGEQKIIEDLGENQDKVHVSWSPNNQVIAYAFTGDPIGQNEQAIVLVGQSHENFKNLLVDGRGFLPAWSPSGNSVVYSVWNSDSDYRPELWFSRADGENINANRLDLHLATWADKCAWQSETIVICGVPLDLAPGAGLQRESLDIGPDVIYRIDLKTGQKTNLGAPGTENPVIVSQMTTVTDSKVFFTDKKTGKLISFTTE